MFQLLTGQLPFNGDYNNRTEDFVGEASSATPV